MLDAESFACMLPSREPRRFGLVPSAMVADFLVFRVQWLLCLVDMLQLVSPMGDVGFDQL